MTRNDDIDEIDLSRHRPSRLPAVLIIGAAVGVALIAAWFFTPILLSKDSATTASLLSASKARAAGPALASAQPTSVAPPAAEDPAPAPSPAPARAAPETTASTPSPWNAQPWPQSRGVQVAAAPPAVTPSEAAAVAPQDTPAEPVENVPLPRKRPSRLIAASLAIPLPRPRPEIELEASAGPPNTFDLQVERMR